MNVDGFTIICCVIIVCAFLASWIYIAATSSENFQHRKKWIEQLPSVVSTLGVLGTFMGITRGLITFDTSDLDTSIPLLLDGLKTAFFTSLFGMAGSLILNSIVCHKFDIENKQSEIKDAAQQIVDTLKANQNNLPSILSRNNKDLVRILAEDDTIKVIRTDVEQLKDDIEEIKGLIQEIRGYIDEQNNTLNSIQSATGKTADELPRIRAVAVTATASISVIDNNVEEINNIVNNIDTAASEINENVEYIKSKDEEKL